MSLDKLFQKQTKLACQAFQLCHEQNNLSYENALLDASLLSMDAGFLNMGCFVIGEDGDEADHKESNIPVVAGRPFSSETAFTHVKIVMPDNLQPSAMEAYVFHLARNMASVHHLTWCGLLTAKCLCIMAQESGLRVNGLHSLDLSAAFPVDTVTLDALASTLGASASDKLTHVHLSCERFMQETKVDQECQESILKVLERFRSLQHLYLYHPNNSITQRSLKMLSSRSSLITVSFIGSKQSSMRALSDIWVVKSNRLSPSSDDNDAAPLYTHTHTRMWSARTLVLHQLKDDSSPQRK
jgi:hypothetical protein